MKTVLAIAAFLFSSSAFAFEFTNCGEEIRSPKLKVAVEAGFAKLDRSETTYTYGIKVNEKREPKICEWSPSREEITVGTIVKADIWSEEGEEGEMMAECFLTLERIEGVWTPEFLVCEDLGVEDDL